MPKKCMNLCSDKTSLMVGRGRIMIHRYKPCEIYKSLYLGSGIMNDETVKSNIEIRIPGLLFLI